MDHRMFVSTVEIAFGSGWMAPVSARNIPPPGEVIVEWYFLVWRCEDNRTRHKILRRRAGKIFGIRGALGNCYVTSRFDEAGKLFVRHFRLVHPKTIDSYPMKRTSIAHFRIFAAHRELAARNPYHPF